jgi:hypothetical protein
MKTLVLLLTLNLFFAGCTEENEVEPTCSVSAIVRDMRGLDGCGWVFELNDGTRLIPQMIMFCGTPPLPKEMTEDPLYQFEYTDGKQVLINYEIIPDIATVCMRGEFAKITCISERTQHTGNE